MTQTVELQEDERRLAELGYKQELQRAWSGFSNFAISFTIISVLAGCFTTYGQAWNNGGPIAISWGWPIICGLILLVAFSMAELVSAYPTAGGIYYWASTLGGPKWGWFTGWFNWVGLVGVVASVDYGCAQFLNATLSLYGLNLGFANWGDTAHIMSETFLLFVVILIIHALINIFSSPLVALFNNISVFWHVAGVAAIVAVLAFVPEHHQSFRFVFGHTINNSGFGHGMFWFYVLPLGFLLTMYTQTGYDWTRLNHHRVPAYAVVFACFCALIMTAPALWGDQNGVPYAFLAVVSICVIGLYIAYVLPVFLRWRMGDAFEPGPWTLGRKYRWINPAAIVWVAICVVIFILPFSPAAVPWRDEFDWRYVNYAPVTVGGLLLIVGVWWAVRARHTFKGPIRNVEFDEGAGIQ